MEVKLGLYYDYFGKWGARKITGKWEKSIPQIVTKGNSDNRGIGFYSSFLHFKHVEQNLFLLEKLDQQVMSNCRNYTFPEKALKGVGGEQYCKSFTKASISHCKN